MELQPEKMYLNLFLSSGLFYHNSLDWSVSNSRVSGWFLLYLCFKEIPVLNASNGDPNQMPIILLWVSRLKWVKLFHSLSRICR